MCNYQYGNIKEVRIIKNKDNSPKGYAYVEFLNEDDAKKALVLDNTVYEEKKLIVKISKSKDSFKEEVGYTIHISNLPFTSNEDDIREFLVGCGTIKQISIVRDEGGNSKGYGFVEFESENGMRKAIMKNNAILSKRNLLIKESKRKITEKKKSTYTQHFAEPDLPPTKQLKIENKARLSNKDFKSLFMSK